MAKPGEMSSVLKIAARSDPIFGAILGPKRSFKATSAFHRIKEAAAYCREVVFAGPSLAGASLGSGLPAVRLPHGAGDGCRHAVARTVDTQTCGAYFPCHWWYWLGFP